jgi:hypothetical protein
MTPSFVRRVGAHLEWRARRASVLVVDPLRRGDRAVIMTPPIGLRFGNWMYLWLQAHSRTRSGRPTVVRRVPEMAKWLMAFPNLVGLTTATEEVRFHDRREWDHEFRYQRFGVDFTSPQIDAFASFVFDSRVSVDPSARVVVNVRRGDYYTPDSGGRFEFDQVGYLQAALARLGRVDDVLVVSDDATWCRAHLDGVLRAAAKQVGYMDPDPLPNFLAVAGARRIIGMNSTFSYWGAHAANVLHENAEIVMPRFHARTARGSDAYQIDPRWTVVEGFHGA